jgi:hypothetical protein
MESVRKIKIVAKQVTYEQAEADDLLYISNLTFEERLKEAFDLRKLNYFGSAEFDLPRIKKVMHTFKSETK